MNPTSLSLVPDRIAVIGPGRLGSALAPALGATLGGRGSDAAGADLVLLTVPDAEIAAAAAAVARGPLLGHCSGATGLDVLGPHEALGLHPLLTITGPDADFRGAGAAVAGTTPRALAVAHALATELGMHAVEIADADRPAYHAAASIASNFLVTLECWAEELLPNGDRSLLAPLVRAAVANWERDGAAALTGPIARGDEATVARQRGAVSDEKLPLWDALVDATRALA